MGVMGDWLIGLGASQCSSSIGLHASSERPNSFTETALCNHAIMIPLQRKQSGEEFLHLNGNLRHEKAR